MALKISSGVRTIKNDILERVSVQALKQRTSGKIMKFSINRVLDRQTKR